jgi:aldose 1-epimerase
MAPARGCLAAILLVGVWIPASAQPYSARQSGDVVQLEDTGHQTVVSIVPSVGNQAIEMYVKGHNVFRWTYASVADFKAKPGMAGVPFLAPWADMGPVRPSSRLH